jgi:Cysteine rich repeat
MLRLSLLALTLSFAVPAMAQDFTPAQRAACKSDYDANCKGTLPGGGRVLACLQKNYAKLSDPCKKVVDAQKK